MAHTARGDSPWRPSGSAGREGPERGPRRLVLPLHLGVPAGSRGGLVPVPDSMEVAPEGRGRSREALLDVASRIATLRRPIRVRRPEGVRHLGYGPLG